MNSDELPESERDRLLPPRFRSSAFRRYEAVLKQAVDNHPNVIEIDPSKFGLSLCTVEQRLRDAKTSYKLHKWTSSIDYDHFIQLCDDLEVRAANGKIFIGPKPPADKDRVVLGTYKLEGPKSKEPLTMQGQSAAQLSTIATLAAERALARPIRIEQLDDAWADSLYSAFDINLEKQPDGSYILT